MWVNIFRSYQSANFEYTNEFDNERGLLNSSEIETLLLTKSMLITHLSNCTSEYIVGLTDIISTLTELTNNVEGY